MSDSSDDNKTLLRLRWFMARERLAWAEDGFGRIRWWYSPRRRQRLLRTLSRLRLEEAVARNRYESSLASAAELAAFRDDLALRYSHGSWRMV